MGRTQSKGDIFEKVNLGWEAVKIEGEQGFRAKRNIRKCQKCKNIIREEFDLETSKWVCPVCRTPTPTREPRNIKDKEDLRQYNKVKQREHRKKWPVEMRKGDNKVGTGYLPGKPKEDKEKEKYEIKKECKRVGIKTTEERLMITGIL